MIDSLKKNQLNLTNQNVNNLTINQMH